MKNRVLTGWVQFFLFFFAMPTPLTGEVGIDC